MNPPLPLFPTPKCRWRFLCQSSGWKLYKYTPQWLENCPSCHYHRLIRWSRKITFSEHEQVDEWSAGKFNHRGDFFLSLCALNKNHNCICMSRKTLIWSILKKKPKKKCALSQNITAIWEINFPKKSQTHKSFFFKFCY